MKFDSSQSKNYISIKLHIKFKAERIRTSSNDLDISLVHLPNSAYFYFIPNQIILQLPISRTETNWIKLILNWSSCLLGKYHTHTDGLTTYWALSYSYLAVCRTRSKSFCCIILLTSSHDKNKIISHFKTEIWKR